MHYRIASVAALALILSGCSTPQHTNLLIFGTNTVVGLKVGADATQTPAIQLAYSRQELVLMPLLANTGASRENGDLLMSPCPAEKVQLPRGAPPTINELSVNCKFVGTQKDKIDAYSVLASFGAKFDAEKQGENVKAGGAIAQYFATGLAARELAKHGSSLVAASESATADSNSSYTEAQAKIISEKNDKARIEFADAIEATANDELLAKIKKADEKATAGGEIITLCPEADSKKCASAIKDLQNLDFISTDRFKLALAGFKS